MVVDGETAAFCELLNLLVLVLIFKQHLSVFVCISSDFYTPAWVLRKAPTSPDTMLEGRMAIIQSSTVRNKCVCVRKKLGKQIFQRTVQSRSFRFGNFSLEPPIKSGTPLYATSAHCRYKKNTTPSRVHLLTPWRCIPCQSLRLLDVVQHMTVCAWLIHAYFNCS